MSNAVLIKVSDKIKGNELEQKLQSTLEIPKEYIFIINTDSKKDLKKVNKSLRKLQEKSKYNAKYHQELISIDKVKHKHYHRNFGVY